MDFGRSYALPSTPTRNTLLKEGVLPATTRVVAGSKFGRGSSLNHRGTDQQQVRASVSGACRPYSIPEPITASPHMTLPRPEWISLGDGWFQATPRRDLGASSARCGLHSVIDGSLGLPFLCIYEPRTTEAIESCINSSEFDLELSAKVIQSNERPTAVEGVTPAFRRVSIHDNSSSASSLSTSLASSLNGPSPGSLNFQVIFAFRSFQDYMIVTADVSTQSWILSRVKAGEETVLAQVTGHELRTNQFYHVLIQVRGNTVSVDVNAVPFITAARVGSDEDSLGGLLGVLARNGSKFAIKGWKIRGTMSKSRSQGGGVSGGGLTIRVPIFSVAPSLQPMKLNEETLEVEFDDGNAGPYYESIGNKSNVFYLTKGNTHVAGPEVVPEQSKFAHQNKHSDNAPKKKSKSLGELMAQRANTTTTTTSSSSTTTFSTTTNDATTTLDSAISASTSVFASLSRTITPGTSSSSNQNSLNCSVTSNAVGSINLRPTRRATAPAVTVQSIFASLGGAPLSGLPMGGGGPGGAITHKTSLENVSHTTVSTPAQQAATVDMTLAAVAVELYQSHDRGIVDTVIRDVVQRDLGISFDDIAALSDAKRLLSEAVILPLMVPEFFTGIREPWKGVLLFGPPGTGKTLLAKAVCSLNQSSFFNCPSSSLVSKYRGESEKIVRCLFEAARLLAPSVVFLDEVDAIVGVRGEGEHEASRRLKTEIFSQMDGIASSNNKSTRTGREAQGPGVMVLGTSNCPWDLDEAMRRRLEKRIFIPLPDAPARLELFTICLRDIPLSEDIDMDWLAGASESYSGADITLVCREAAMMPMRRLLSVMKPTEMQALRQNGQLLIPRVMMEDFRQAFSNTRPSVAQETSRRYESWEREFGNK